MKRRNADCAKLRRPLKRSKITEGIYGSTFLYVKFLMVWGLVLMADFILEFRFEYLWPFWLLLRSVYDSFKYQGLAFSVFFMCVAVTSDVVCYLFIPVQWLFFAASTYVWVQYVWHTDRGICLPTVSLWLLFVYIEASVRLREFKSLPFHLDLCRPFAAHCIGYPVVTLGFGFKSYVSYRMRVRKQKDVQKENDFYVQLLQQALPEDQQHTTEKLKAASNAVSPSQNGKVVPASTEEVISNGVSSPSNTYNNKKSSKLSSSSPTSPEENSSKDTNVNNKTNNKHTPHIEDYHQIIEHSLPPSHKQRHHHSVNDYEEENYRNDEQAKAYNKQHANGVTSSKNASKLNTHRDLSASNATSNATATSGATGSRKGKSNNTNSAAGSTGCSAATAGKDSSTGNSSQFTNNKEDLIPRLEADIKRLKADLQSSRNCEQELRSQISNLMVGDKSTKSELYQLRQDNESLQQKLHNLVTSRQQDKQNLQLLERKLQDERKCKAVLEQQLATERKAKKDQEAANRASALAAARDCSSETCKSRRREMDAEMKNIRRELKLREDQLRQLERETQTLRQYKEAQSETEVLMSALAAMQDKNAHLENSLSAETRLKLDLFSALGDAKRQIEIQQGLLVQKEHELKELKQKVAEAMALMPPPASYPGGADTASHFSAKFSSAPGGALPRSAPSPGSPAAAAAAAEEEEILVMSSLNPNASDYTPKAPSPSSP